MGWTLNGVKRPEGRTRRGRLVGLKIICSGYIVRYPLGGKTWHELQYLLGLQSLGHKVTYVEHYGWADSCYDPARNVMTGNPSYGIEYVKSLLRPYGLDNHWCYIAEDGRFHGMSRKRLAQLCRDCDIYINQSNVNWFPELEECRLRVLVDTDPVFTQIGAHGFGGLNSRYHCLFTYGENVHQSGSDMPTGGVRWLPTRPPVVLNQWRVEPGNRGAPFTTVMNWSPLGDLEHEGRVYGMKERGFEPFFSLPRERGQLMEIAVKVPTPVRTRLIDGGWRLASPVEVTRDPWTYQHYLRASRAEFSVAKHGYVTTRCGWFSERSASYLASGRPTVIEDTGFTAWLPSGLGVIPFNAYGDAVAGIDDINTRYNLHCRTAREIAEEYFDSRKVLSSLIDRSMNGVPVPPADSTQEPL